MIVSILQLMGFPMGKPVHSRAGETPSVKPSKAVDGKKSTKDHAQASATRRQEVKATTPKSSKATPAKGKAAVAAKPVAKAPPAKAKPAVKVVAKSVAKPAPKAPAKPATKPAAKPVAKSAAKPAVSKPVAKKAAKPAAKAPVKVPVKAKVKAPVKPVPAKAVPKASAKVAVKAVAKPAPKATPVVAVPPKTVAKPAAKEKVSPPMPPIAPKAAPAPVTVAAPVASAVPQKAGRPSSRLAQLTVPSMAQSVASTAAKASYSQVISAPVIVPALPSSIKKDPKLANNWKTKPAAELTDAELMAMSDDDYMNDAQMAAFRAKLVVLKQDILNSAGETTEHLREDTSVVPDPADRATIEEEHALELRTRDRERKLLKKIEQSIGRIDAGDYGYCDETGEPIGVGRLLARPTATLSLEAQQRRELKQKMFGD
jgi:DnaK suppressor protein